MKMPFGKYRDEELEDIPTSYLEWCLRELELSDDLAEEMENQLRMRAGEGVVRQRSRS